MRKPKYKRIIKSVLFNSSNNQLQLTLAKGCGIEKGDLVQLVPFDKSKELNEDVIVKVIMNKTVEQLLVTVPKSSSFEKGDLVEAIPLNCKAVDMEKYPIYERSEVYRDDDGKIKIKKKGGKQNE